MMQLMDASEHTNRLEAEHEEARKEAVTWIQRVEKFKAEWYQHYACLIDAIPPPPRPTE